MPSDDKWAVNPVIPAKYTFILLTFFFKRHNAVYTNSGTFLW